MSKGKDKNASLGDPVNTPHDKAFKGFFADPDMLELLLRDIFGDRADKFKFETMRICKTQVVNRILGSSHGDFLLKICYDGIDVNVYILIEHKSYNHKYALLQLLLYMVQIWYEECSQGVDKFTPIIPVLYVHGKNEWTHGSKFSGMFSDDAKSLLGNFIPDFDSVVFDLNKIGRGDLSDNLEYVSFVMMQKLIHDLPDNMKEIAGYISSVFNKYGEDSPALLMFTYLLAVAKDHDRDSVKSAFEELKKEGDFMTLLDRIKIESREEGEELGLKKGEELGLKKGREEGERKRAIEDAIRMKERLVDIETISYVTRLSIEEIERL